MRASICGLFPSFRGDDGGGANSPRMNSQAMERDAKTTRLRWRGYQGVYTSRFFDTLWDPEEEARTRAGKKRSAA